MAQPKRPNKDAFRTVKKIEIGVIGNILFELQVWNNEHGSLWVLMMYGEDNQEHVGVNDRTAAMLLRNKAAGDAE